MAVAGTLPVRNAVLWVLLNRIVLVVVSRVDVRQRKLDHGPETSSRSVGRATPDRSHARDIHRSDYLLDTVN